MIFDAIGKEIGSPEKKSSVLDEERKSLPVNMCTVCAHSFDEHSFSCSCSPAKNHPARTYLFIYSRERNKARLLPRKKRDCVKKEEKRNEKMVGFSEENIHGVGSEGKELSLSSLFSLEHTVNNSFRIINTVEKIAFRNIIYAFTCLSVGLFSPSFTVEAFHFSFFLFFFYFVSSQNSFSTFFLRNPRFGNGCVEREVSKTRSIDRIPRQFAVEGKFVCALCAASNSIPRSSGSLTSLFVDTNLASLLLLRLLRPPAAKGHHR